MFNIVSCWTLFGVLIINCVSAQTPNHHIQWNGNNWAMSCDFRGNDLSNVRISGEHCGEKCAQTKGETTDLDQ